MCKWNTNKSKCNSKKEEIIKWLHNKQNISIEKMSAVKGHDRELVRERNMETKKEVLKSIVVKVEELKDENIKGELQWLKIE
jgi:hypothetical protein